MRRGRWLGTDALSLSKTLPFLFCAAVTALILLLEQGSPAAWKTVKGYLLSRPIFFHSLVVYLMALLLALFTYRSLYNFKILLAGFFFLMNGVFGLLFFTGMPLPSGGAIQLPRAEGLRQLLYLLYSLDLLLVAAVPSYLPRTLTRTLLVLSILVQGALLAAAISSPSGFATLMQSHAGLLSRRPLLLFWSLNVAVALISLALSSRRRDPYGWAAAGFIVLLSAALSAPGRDTERLLLLSIPFVLSLLVLANLTISLSHRANYDPLMNIYNRGFCNNLLQGRGRPLGKKFAVALFDLDHFKKVNDRYGHRTGDVVLHWVAQRVREKALPRGITCRYGGEEIIVIFPDTSLAYAERVAREVVAWVAQTPVPIARGKGKTHLRVTVSGGIAGGEAGRRSGTALVEAADRALYRSKRLGRNRLSVVR
ncbi:MAG: GGDEF domain-containing protein [bacterium]